MWNTMVSTTIMTTTAFKMWQSTVKFIGMYFYVNQAFNCENIFISFVSRNFIWWCLLKNTKTGIEKIHTRFHFKEIIHMPSFNFRCHHLIQYFYQKTMVLLIFCFFYFFFFSLHCCNFNIVCINLHLCFCQRTQRVNSRKDFDFLLDVIANSWCFYAVHFALLVQTDTWNDIFRGDYVINWI